MKRKAVKQTKLSIFCSKSREFWSYKSQFEDMIKTMTLIQESTTVRETKIDTSIHLGSMEKVV